MALCARIKKSPPTLTLEGRYSCRGALYRFLLSDRYLVTLLVVEEKGRKQSFVGFRSSTQPTWLIDERKGRQIAREIYGLQVIGSARVLVEAKRQGYLDNVEKAIIAMRQHGYWLHENIVAVILKKAGER